MQIQIPDIKLKILEYIFEEKTINFLITNGYDISKRNLHYYTIKAFQQKKLLIAWDLILNDIFDLDFSWTVSHSVKHKNKTDKEVVKFNVLSYLINNGSSEKLLIKVIKSNTCDLTLVDENYNTFIQLIMKKMPKFFNTINMLIERADASTINNFNNFGYNIINMDWYSKDYLNIKNIRYTAKVFANPNYDPIHNIDLFNKMINSYYPIITNNNGEKKKLYKVLKYIYDYCNFKNKQITINNYKFYFDVAIYFNLFPDMYTLVITYKNKLDFVLNIIKYLALSYSVDNLNVYGDKIKNFINSIDYKLFPEFYYLLNEKKYNSKYLINYEIGIVLKYIKSNISTDSFDSNLILALNIIESKININWDSGFLPVIENIDDFKNKLTIENDLKLIEKLIIGNYFEECEHFVSNTINTIKITNHGGYSPLYNKGFEPKSLDNIMEICIEKYPNLIRLLTTREFIECKINKEYYWTTYTYSTLQININYYDYYQKNQNQLMFRYQFYLNKLIKDLESDNFQLNKKDINSNQYQYLLYKAFIELVNSKNLLSAQQIIKYVDLKTKFDKKTNQYVIELLISNNYDKILFELIKNYSSNPLYFIKLTNINLNYSVYSYCIKNNFTTQSLQIVRAFKTNELKKYLVNNKSEENFINLTCTQDDFYWACFHANSRLIYVYLDNNLGKYDYVDQEGNTPLMYLAINNLEDEAIKLFKTGMSLSTKLNNSNKSALHFAIENKLEILSNLLYNELKNLIKK